MTLSLGPGEEINRVCLGLEACGNIVSVPRGFAIIDQDYRALHRHSTVASRNYEIVCRIMIIQINGSTTPHISELARSGACDEVQSKFNRAVAPANTRIQIFSEDKLTCPFVSPTLNYLIP